MFLGFEVFILFLIIGTQLYFFYSTGVKIKALGNLFPDFKLTEDHIKTYTYDEGPVEQVDILNHDKEEFQNIIKATNSYLRKNKGSADFGIIKNVAERISDSQEAAVTTNIGLPLYIGLMGTFIGVIIGLGVLIAQAEFGNAEIKAFILGVVVAMVGSFFGLLFTTLNNAYSLRKAKAKRDRNKNNYYNFLQTELLPNLDNSLYSALESLKVNISDFNKVFEKNTLSFDETFGKKVDVLKDAVSQISSNIDVINEGNKVQKDFLIEIRKKGYVRMAEVSIEFFEKVTQAAPMLTDFIERQEMLTNNINYINELTVRIKSLFDRFTEFETGINRLGRDLKQSDLLGNETLVLVRKHLNAIQHKEQLIEDYSIKSTDVVKEYLSNAFNQIEELKRRLELHFENAFNFNIEGNVLQKLNHLPEIELILQTSLQHDTHKKLDSDLEKKLSEIVTLLKELNVFNKRETTFVKNDVSSEVLPQSPSMMVNNAHEVHGHDQIMESIRENVYERQGIENTIVKPNSVPVVSDSVKETLHVETIPKLPHLEKQKKGWFSKIFFKKLN